MPMLLLSLLLLATACYAAPTTRPASPDERFVVGELLCADDFADVSHWTAELEKGGAVTASGGAMTIDVPGGASVWLKRKIDGPVMIEYDATVVMAGGPNDRLSDLNCFWMASDPRGETDFFAAERDGAFASYNAMRTYYASLGGNANSTTRFRRYIGSPTTRPLLPQHDLRQPADLLVANQKESIRCVAAGDVVQFYRGERRLFDVVDEQPYTSGYFALRTVASRLKIERFRVWRLESKSPATRPAS